MHSSASPSSGRPGSSCGSSWFGLISEPTRPGHFSDRVLSPLPVLRGRAREGASLNSRGLPSPSNPLPHPPPSRLRPLRGDFYNPAPHAQSPHPPPPPPVLRLRRPLRLDLD